MVNAASEAAVLPNMNIPDNLTEVVEMLKEFSLALEENGAIYNMVDDLGNITSMVYRFVVALCSLYMLNTLHTHCYIGSCNCR